MKAHSLLRISFLLFFLIVLCTAGFSQSKKEKKQAAKTMNAGMYDGTESEEAMKFYMTGVKYSQVRDFKKAIKYYKKSLKYDDKFVEAYDNIGVCYRNLGDFKKAEEYYLKSIELYPNGKMAHMNLGLLYRIQRDYDKAVNEYDKLKEIDPDDPESYYGVIIIYIELKKYDLAIENGRKAVEIYEATDHPYLSDAQYFLGLSYYYNNEDDNARIYIQQAKDNGMDIPAEISKELNIK